MKCREMQVAVLEAWVFLNLGLVAQWITRLTTDQKIPGSNPGKLVILLSVDKPTFINKWT